MDAKTIATIVNGLAVGAYGVAALRRGYRRRRSRWTGRSWASFTIVGASVLALYAVGFAVAVADSSWIGAPHSNARAGWILVSLGALTTGTLLALGLLAWFANGDATRQFGLRGPMGDVHPALSESDPEEPPLRSVSRHRQPNER